MRCYQLHVAYSTFVPDAVFKSPIIELNYLICSTQNDHTHFTWYKSINLLFLKRNPHRQTFLFVITSIL